ncbi:MAG: hypothetical protein WC645_03595 [Candidatus Margulisiibacteriota bacterium]
MKNRLQTKICYVENLTFPIWLFYVLPYLIKARFGGSFIADKVYYIDGSKAAIYAAALTSWLTKMKLHKLAFRLVDIRDEKGNLLRLRIAFKDLAGIQKNIMENPIYKDFIKYYPARDSLRVFIEKQIATVSLDGSSMFRALFLIQVIAWKSRMEKAASKDSVLFMDRRLWMQEIKQYGLENNVIVVPVKNIKLLLMVHSGMKIFIKNTYINIVRFIRRQKSVGQSASHPKLAVEYYGHLNLNNPELHSDLFFYQQSQLSGKDILITFAIPRDPLDQKKADEINRHEMETIVINPKATSINSAPIYNPPAQGRRNMEQRNWGGELEKRWLVSRVNDYSYRSDYWRKLFKENNIKTYIHWYKYDGEHCAIANALRDLGGVMTIYQRAFEEMSSAETAIAADIVFGFSSGNALLEKESHSIIPYHVTVGYFGDHRFGMLKTPAEKIRDKMHRNGAKHILAFFDENSASDSRWHTGHEFMRENYAFLLEKVISEKWLGAVFKPKVPITLRQRLGKVAELLKRAEETGRCYVFEEGALHGSYPPAIAALASDVTIHGHLCAATAGVEAALAGVPTLLMDREGWPISKFYKLGKGHIVFDNWQNAWDVCLEHWKTREGIPGFGDWGPMLDEIDPFRDGRAAERIGTYLEWILAGFKAGQKRERILADAASRYCKLWGNDKVIEVK